MRCSCKAEFFSRSLCALRYFCSACLSFSFSSSSFFNRRTSYVRLSAITLSFCSCKYLFSSRASALLYFKSSSNISTLFLRSKFSSLVAILAYIRRLLKPALSIARNVLSKNSSLSRQVTSAKLSLNTDFSKSTLYCSSTSVLYLCIRVSTQN